MKTLFVSIVLMASFMLALSGVVMANQVVSINGTEVINFTLTNLEFGTVVPGELAEADSMMTLHESNNVDFNLEIYLQEGSNSLFDLIVLNLVNIGGEADADLGVGSLNSVLASVTDSDLGDEPSQQNYSISAELDVPVGIAPGPRSSTIVYSISGSVV